MVIGILASMSPVLLRIAGFPVLAIPVQFPMMVFGIFTALLQALVFSMLLCIYIGVTIGDHHAHEHNAHLGPGEEHEIDLLANAVPV
jgi:hypothetical protein